MKKLIITEGNDDQKFFEGLLDFLRIRDVEVASVNPKQRGSKVNIFTISDIKQHITSKTEEFPSKILITCDADFEADGGKLGGFKKTKEESKKILNGLKSSYKNTGDKKIKFFILPNNEKDGNLESLFLESLSLSPVVTDCVNSYHSCLSHQNISLKTNSKTKAMSLLAAIGGGDVYKVGYAAFDNNTKSYRTDYWNFQSPALESLRTILQDFFR